MKTSNKLQRNSIRRAAAKQTLSILEKAAVTFAKMPCMGHLYEVEIPKELKKEEINRRA